MFVRVLYHSFFYFHTFSHLNEGVNSFFCLPITPVKILDGHVFESSRDPKGKGGVYGQDS